jgi:hypothetical protein
MEKAQHTYVGKTFLLPLFTDIFIYQYSDEITRKVGVYYERGNEKSRDFLKCLDISV